MAPLQQHTATDIFQEQQLFFQIIVLERQIYAWVGVAPARLSTLCLATPTPLVRAQPTRCQRLAAWLPAAGLPPLLPVSSMPLLHVPLQDPVPAATSLLRGPGADDEITSMSQRLGEWGLRVRGGWSGGCSGTQCLGGCLYPDAP